MADRRKWNWDVAGFETRKVSEQHGDSSSTRASVAPMVRRYSVASSSVSQHEIPVKQSLVAKVQKLKDKVKLAREDYVQLRQEATELQEYSNVKLQRVMRYLGVLADKSHKLDQAALEMEAKIAPLISEKKRLFNDLVTVKGNVKVFCRSRPAFIDEGPSIVEFPDDFTIRINTGDESGTSPKKDFEFDRVYGPHIGQVELFNDVQPLVQSALDGYNVSIFSYGQRGSGKTYTMEGTINDRGLYARCFEELFDLSSTDTTSTSQYQFYVSVFEIYNEQIADLLCESGKGFPSSSLGYTTSLPELLKEKVINPLDFTRVVKVALKNRGADSTKHIVSHMVVTVYIHCTNSVTGENSQSKLSLVDLAGSNNLDAKADNGEYVTDTLYAMKSLSALGDVMSSLTSNKDIVPYENSILTGVFADSLGGSAKTLMIIHLCPSVTNLSETLSTLKFASRARNTLLSLGSQDTIQKWKDLANDARKELYEKEKEIHDLKQEVLGLKQALKDANDQCGLLLNEVQKAWKVSYTLQSEVKTGNNFLEEKYKIEKDQNEQLRNQLAQLLQMEQDHKIQIQQQETTIKTLQDKVGSMALQLNETLQSNESRAKSGVESGSTASSATDDDMNSSRVIKKLEEELQKRDILIERLHNENEKLFGRLTEKAAAAPTPQLALPAPNGFDGGQNQDSERNDKNKGQSPVAQSPKNKPDGTLALTKSGSDNTKSTPAGEYLTAALNDFDPDQFDSLAAISDGANKLLMLVLAAVIKAGASREHEILAEIRDAVFSFIRKMEPRRVMDTMLVSRVRILYIRSLLARSPELQSIKVPPVDRFLEKPNAIQYRNSSQGGGSTGWSPGHYESSSRNAIVDEHFIHSFRVNIKQEKKSKFSSAVSKLRGMDQESWKQQVTGGKLREITEEAKGFAIGNRALAALFVHTPAGELQRQIRSWLAEHFEFLSVTGDDAVVRGSAGQLELLSTAVMDGWMAGLGSAMPPRTDALGQLLSEYARRVFTSQLQHLKDIAGTLAMEEAEDSPQVAKLRSALESVDHKRRKLLQQIKSEAATLNLEEGSEPIQHPSTAAEDARLASLISLDSILKQVKEIVRQASVTKLSKTKKKALLESLDDLTDRMPSLLYIDHPCAQRQIADAREMVESIPEEEEVLQESSFAQPDLVSNAEMDVSQWNVLQFNTGSTSPFIIKCGASSNSELVIKADSRVQEPKGGEIMRVVPRPALLEKMSLEEMRQVFSQLPEALSLLALARTADATRARYSRLYKTLAMKVPSLSKGPAP